MRLPTELWVKAYLRRLSGQGIYAAIVKRGDDDYGTLWVKVSRLDGHAMLFGPAPEPLDAPPLDRPGPDRRFLRMHKAAVITEADADKQLQQARAFDSDLWIVEIEDRGGRHDLDDWIVSA